ncbi:MAG TPA: M50 family metallopeptidase [Streptosporangiales bacterium]
MSQFAVLGVTGIVAFCLALGFSVMLHEAGHFLFAKKFGMKATEFFIGFGPRIWSKVRGETEYGIKAIPAGGYVKIVGMTPLEELAPGDEARAFYRQRPWHRFVVLIAGSATHFLIGIVLLLVLVMGVGLPIQTQTLTMQAVSTCVPTTNEGDCAKGSPESPAAKAKLKPGDRITAFNGKPVKTWDEVSKDLRVNGGKKVTLTVTRNGTSRDVTVRLATVTDAASGKQIGYLGVVSKAEITGYQTYGPVDGAAAAGTFFVREIGLIFQTLGDIPAALPKLFSPERADSKGGQVGSVVGAARMAGDVFGSDTPGRAKASYFLNMVQSVNVFIGVFNLLPLLPMDGGHVAVLVWERVRAWFARRRGRPDPGPVNMNKLLPATYFVFVLLVGLGLVLVAADLVNPLKTPF